MILGGFLHGFCREYPYHAYSPSLTFTILIVYMLSLSKPNQFYQVDPVYRQLNVRRVLTGATVGILGSRNRTRVIIRIDISPKYDSTLTKPIFR